MAKYEGEVILEMAAPEAQAGIGEKVRAGLYGAATGFVGSPGEFEKLAAYDVPEFLGADVERGKGVPFGRETFFPTIEEAQKLLGAAGISKPRGEVSGYQTAGEIIGGLGTAIPALARGAKALYRTDIVQSLSGKKTGEQAAKLAEEAAAAGASGAAALAKEAAEATRQETTLGARAKLAPEERIKMAEEVAASAKARSVRLLGGLPGVSAKWEAGAFRAIPETPAQIGGYIRQQAENFLDSVKKQRSLAADTNFTATKTSASAKEQLGQFVDTKPLIATLDDLIKKGGSSDYLRSIQGLKGDLIGTRSFEGLEVIRRRLGDAAFGAPEEGYKAIGQGFAKDMYGDLAVQMKTFEPAFAKYLDDYKRLSKTIEAHTTKVGKGLTETQDLGGKYHVKTAEQISKDIFSSPEKYAQFVDAVGGNKQIAESAARRYFANLLENKNTTAAVEDVFKKNRDLLGTHGPLRAVARELEANYLFPLQKLEARMAGAANIVEQAKKFDVELAVKLKNVKEAQTLFSDSVKALAVAKPKDAISVFDNTVLPKLRKAEERAGITLIAPAQIAQLRARVTQLEKVADQQTRNRIIGGLIGGYLLGQKTVSTVEKVFGE